MLIQTEMKTAAAKTAAGYGLGGLTYITAMTLEQAQAYAAIFAALMTGLYFFVQFAYTAWKWRKETKQRRRPSE